MKNLLLFKADLGPTAIVLLTNVMYAGLAIMLLSRIYDSESVLFDEGRGGLQLFEKRSNIVAGGTPTTGDAWFIVFFVMIIYLYPSDELWPHRNLCESADRTSDSADNGYLYKEKYKENLQL